MQPLKRNLLSTALASATLMMVSAAYAQTADQNQAQTEAQAGDLDTLEVVGIRRSIQASIDAKQASTSIVEAISSLGRGMALPITAEGIESAEVLVALRKFGKFKGQGYLYGKPVSGQDVRTELAEQDLLNNTSAEDQHRLAQEPENPAAING